ncbi:cytochrome P450 [Bombardia bombarda]|uniref:Cytochrome P450 n=1 Tax=Bombardia bombarda TaxID=252184 RepID=A0AA39XA99_9PEZI|nr:cytochrome P450 [Bombardia bombarda]
MPCVFQQVGDISAGEVTAESPSLCRPYMALACPRSMTRGCTSKPCFVVPLTKAQEIEGFSEDLAAYIAGVGLEAGSNTVAATLIAFLQAMALFPNVMKKAQATIDDVCGDRLPDINDMDVPKAHYIRCCIKESLRWFPSTIVGVPHTVIRDDEYMGYRIPKGATIVLNAWSVFISLSISPLPSSKYRHSHHPLTGPSTATPTATTTRASSTCPGSRATCRPRASRASTRTPRSATTLCLARGGASARACTWSTTPCSWPSPVWRGWAFDIFKAVDEHGIEIKPNPDDLDQGLIVKPKLFPMEIKPRSEERARTVRREWDECCRGLLDGQMEWRAAPEGMPFVTYDPKADKTEF